MLAFKTKLHYTHDETIRLNEFSKNARYEVNIRKFAVVLQISNKQSDVEARLSAQWSQKCPFRSRSSFGRCTCAEAIIASILVTEL